MIGMTVRLRVYQLIVCALIWSILYWACAIYNILYPTVVEGINGALLFISTIVTFKFSRSIWKLWLAPVTGAALIRVGIVLSWSATAFVAGRILWFAYQDDIVLSKIAFTPFRGYLEVIAIMGAVLHILAIGAIDGQPLLRNIVISATSLVAGALLGVAIMWSH